MSSVPFITLEEFDGSQGYVKTKGFVNWEVDLRSHAPRQKVVLGDSELGDVQLPCVIYADDIDLEEGCGYIFGGFDYAYEKTEEIQLLLGTGSWIKKIYDPNE